MDQDDIGLEDKWLVHIMEAAKQLSLGHYNAYPSNCGGRCPVATAAVTLKTPKSDFMRDRCGSINVDICEGWQYEVVVKSNNGLASLRPLRKKVR
jgi:hypothetical protein